MKTIKIERYDNAYNTAIQFRAWWEDEKALITIGTEMSARKIMILVQEWTTMNWPEEPKYMITIIDSSK